MTDKERIAELEKEVSELNAALERGDSVMQAAIQDAIQKERQACAKIASDLGADKVAAAITSRY